MRAILAASVVVATVACAAAAQTALTWTPRVSGAGYGIVLAPRDGPAVFSLACVRGTSEILAIAYGVPPQPGRQEFEVRIDQRRFTFIVKPQAMKDGKMIEAAAKAGPSLLSAIASARVINAAYGQARLGPYPAPPTDLAHAFAQRCGPLV